MKITAFIAVSVDGYIARADGSLDWMKGGASDYGYQAYFDSVDALVIGRRTYERARQFETWPYGFKRVLVLSHNYVEIPQPLVRFVESTQYPPAALVENMRQAGIRHLTVDGGQVIQSFIHAGLLEEITVTRVPVLLGSGIPLFGEVPTDRPLRLLNSETYDGDVQQSRYELSRANLAGNKQ